MSTKKQEQKILEMLTGVLLLFVVGMLLAVAESTSTYVK